MLTSKDRAAAAKKSDTVSQGKSYPLYTQTFSSKHSSTSHLPLNSAANVSKPSSSRCVNVECAKVCSVVQERAKSLGRCSQSSSKLSTIKSIMKTADMVPSRNKAFMSKSYCAKFLLGNSRSNRRKEKQDLSSNS